MNNFLLKAIGVPWVDKGRDITGWDCWGMIVCFYKEIFNIDINPLENVSYANNPQNAIRAMLIEAKKWEFYKLGEEKIGDVILIRPIHSGVVIGKDKMLHCLVGSETCIERYNNIIWRDRLIGFYRNVELSR